MTVHHQQLYPQPCREQRAQPPASTVQEVQGQQLQQAGTGNLDLVLGSDCPDNSQVPEKVQQVTTGNVDLNEADSNQPAAGVAREAENLEKQQVPIEVQQQAVRVAREAEIPEKQQVPIQLQQAMTDSADINVVAVCNEPAASDAREMEITERQQVLVNDDLQLVCADQQPAAGSARKAEIPEKQQVPDEVQQVTTGNIDLNVAVYNEPAAGNAREMEISEGQQVLVKDDSQLVCGD